MGVPCFLLQRIKVRALLPLLTFLCLGTIITLQLFQTVRLHQPRRSKGELYFEVREGLARSELPTVPQPKPPLTQPPQPEPPQQPSDIEPSEPNAPEVKKGKVALRCELHNMWSRAHSCSPSIAKVYFVVKNIEFGSAHQRGIQPAYALQQFFGIQTSIIDCSYFCRQDKMGILNERISQKTTKMNVFIHMDVPCACVLQAKHVSKATHILEVMDTLAFTPPDGFDEYIVATENVQHSVMRMLASRGLRIPVKVVPCHDSNLLGRGSEVRNDLKLPVSNVLYMGSKPLPEMISKVRTLLASKYNITLRVHGPEIADNVSSALSTDEMKEASVEDLWPHSVAYSDTFAAHMNLRRSVAIVWDQCSEYTAQCPDSSGSCVEHQRELCLSMKDDARLVVHLGLGLPTMVYNEYLSHKGLLHGSSYPLTASTLDELVVVLEHAIQNSTVRTLSSSIGLDVTVNRTLCAAAGAYFTAICDALE